MFDLLYSEWRRFRGYALVAALIHLLLLVFLQRTVDLLQMAYFEAAAVLGVYLLAGITLAVVQVGSYRKPSQWLWLIHRPLAPPRIFLAMSGAALLLLIVVLLLPQLVLVAGMDLLTSQVVDLRHYISTLLALCFALLAWLASCHAVLSRTKLAILVLAAPLLMAVHLASVWVMLLVMLLALTWFGVIAMASFRANRDALPASNGVLLVTALTMQIGFFLLMCTLGKFAYMTGGTLFGLDPRNTDYPPAGGLIEVERKAPADAMVMALQGSRDPRAAEWSQELPLLEPISVPQMVARTGVRHQFSNLYWENPNWQDAERAIEWTFSHDRMLYLGRDPQSGKERGVWGIAGLGDETPFPEVPVAFENQFLLTRHVLYAIDAPEQRLHEVLRLPADERFISVEQNKFQRMMVLTDKQLRVYRPDRNSASTYAPWLIDWKMALPKGAQHLVATHLVQLMDGWLVSFLYGDGFRQVGNEQFFMLTQPQQQTFFIDEHGRSQRVAERLLSDDYPALYRVNWWVSPLLHVLVETPDRLIDKGLAIPLQTVRWPSGVLMPAVAAALMVLSLLGGIYWLRGTPITPRRRRLWLTSCALLGLPALLSLICLQPRGRVA